MKKLFLIAIAAVAAFGAAPTYKIINKIKVGGPTRWDYVYVDSNNHRLYASHTGQVEVIDTAADKLVGTIMGTTGVHGIAIAPDLNRGFVSDGGDNDVTVFDLKTLAVITKVKTGQNPDAIIYEPVSHRDDEHHRDEHADAHGGREHHAAPIDADDAAGDPPEPFHRPEGSGRLRARWAHVAP